mgnify:CR=1 FL=1
MINNLSELQKKDLKYVFHPCAQMKDFEENPPLVIKKGDGLYLIDENGNRYMDCISSWWVNLFGHCNERINKVITEQVNTLEHIIFANFAHEPAAELCEELTKVLPKGINKFLFSDNGSSCIEMALKLSFQYHLQTGNPQKTKFISLENAYHGETIGALGVGDVDIFTETYRPLIKEGRKVRVPYVNSKLSNEEFTKLEDECIKELEEIIENTIKVEEAKKHHDKVIEVGKNIEIELKNELQNTIQKSLIETLEGLYKEYVNRIKKLTVTENKIINEEILINPFEMIEGSIESFKSFDEFRTEYSEIKNEIIGTREVENEREWWEFWRWLEPSTVIIDVYGDVEYVNMNNFLDNYHDKIETFVFKITDKALQYGKAEISKVEEQFIKTKEQLDNILKNKLEYISELIQNKKNTSTNIEKKFKEFDEKIKWLESIKKRIEEIIEI